MNMALFACVHSSARSQMVEAFFKRRGGSADEAESACLESEVVRRDESRPHFPSEQVWRPPTLRSFKSPATSIGLFPSRSTSSAARTIQPATRARLPRAPRRLGRCRCAGSSGGSTPGSPRRSLVATRPKYPRARRSLRRMSRRRTPPLARLTAEPSYRSSSCSSSWQPRGSSAEAGEAFSIMHTAAMPARYSTLRVRRRPARPSTYTRNPTGPARNVSTSATVLSGHGTPSFTLSRAIQAPTTMSNTR